MPPLIKHQQVITDEWTVLPLDSDLAPADKQLVPAREWAQKREQFLGMQAIGVWLESDDDLAAIVPDLARYSVIAINFPVFSDGRGYSLARTLRERYNYTGELRAIGDVLIDQLHYLQRCGFDAFALRADLDPETALGALTPFSEAYQAASDQPVPLFRRR
jgi:uncharacterized protein (DUF934 family)